MWRTSQGERVLTGGEAAAFKAGLSDLVEDLAEWRHDQSTGVEAFDALSYGQRLALLVDLAGALLNPSVPPPSHTSANEAAVHAIYRQLFTLIEVELDSDTPATNARQLVRTACFERGLDALSDTDDDLDAWRIAVETLSDQVLWDRDFEDGAMFLDAAPESVNRDEVGVGVEYFATVSRELRDAEIEPTLVQLRQLGQ